MLYRNVRASLILTCLPLDLTLRSLNMSHGDLTLGHCLEIAEDVTGTH